MTCLLWGASSSAADATAKPMPRVIIGLYDADYEHRPQFSLTHRFLEMPLNHLGFDVRYYNVNGTLPPLGEEVYGVVWFFISSGVIQSETFLNWLYDAVTKGKKVVVFGDLGPKDTFRDTPEGMRMINRFFNALGVQDMNAWAGVTYLAKIYSKNPRIVDFERKIEDVLPSYMDIRKVGSDSVSHFSVVREDEKRKDISDLIVTTPRGGYVAPGYGIYYNNKTNVRLWQIDPFAFFNIALSAHHFPRPDVSTLNGMRVFYGHIDGDGWNNITEIKSYGLDRPLAAEVIKREILEAYPDMPFNVGAIVTELQPECYGVKKSKPVARDIFALPNVEPSSHTHSHPLYWGYFADGNALKEKELLSLYSTPPERQKGLLYRLFGKANPPVWSKDAIEKLQKNPVAPHEDTSAAAASREGYRSENVQEVLDKYFGIPRSYACEPFDLDQEIQGSIDYINTLSPPDKKVRLIQWSGDTSPFDEAIKRSRAAGVRNINGGDSRYDAEYPSYAWVSPVGIRVGGQQQIFSSNSNENTYTKLWKGQFYGFRYLQNTAYNTDTPVRLKPFNVYFHMFSGEKQASVNAIKENLDFARTQEIIPIFASDYAAMADGFFTTQMIPLGGNSEGGGRWQIKNRDGLQTIRFDLASDKRVDFARSEGVMGQRWIQGSLYVALDPTVANPVVAIEPHANNGLYPEHSTPYLIKSRWRVEGWKPSQNDKKNALSFVAYGFGAGEIQLKAPPGEYETFVKSGKNTILQQSIHVNNSGLLNLVINYTPELINNSRLEISITSK